MYSLILLLKEILKESMKNCGSLIKKNQLNFLIINKKDNKKTL